MVGFTLFFARDAAEREANDDPRPSIGERYESRDAYLTLARAQAEKLANTTRAANAVAPLPDLYIFNLTVAVVSPTTETGMVSRAFQTSFKFKLCRAVVKPVNGRRGNAREQVETLENEEWKRGVALGTCDGRPGGSGSDGCASRATAR